MSRGSFVHLHVHSDYSMLDGASRLDDLVHKVHALGMPAVAVTDHGNLCGAIEFYEKARKAEVQPILGIEAYVAPGDRRDKTEIRGIAEASFHLTLLAADEEGYRNLLKLSTLSFREGFYYRPRMDRSILAEHARGLIALSGCPNSEFGSACVREEYDRALGIADAYRQIFGADRFYLEIQDHGMEDERRVREGARRAAENLGLPLVATNDVHYISKDDHEAHDVLLAISTGKLVTDTNRLRFNGPEYHVKTPDEMRAIFKEVPDACDHTLEIAERCRIELPFGKLHLPRFEPPDGRPPCEYLRALALEGMKRRYPAPGPEVAQRFEYELSVIEKCGFEGYFLIVWDIVAAARRMGVRVGGGRGSAAGSLVSYCLGITDIDPLRYGLLFERFLNPQRIEMPDIDLDMSHEGRGRVLDYIRERYGRDNVTQIITFSKLKARAVIKDVARAMGIERAAADRLASQVPELLNIRLAQAIELDEKLREASQKDPQVAKLLAIGQRLEGLCRHASRHAAGVIIADRPLVEYVPIYVQEGEECAQYDMNAVARLGLLKIDVLGLQMLTVIDRALALIEGAKGVKVDLDALPLDDAKTFALLGSGDVRGVFQLDSSRGIRELIQGMKPDTINDIIATVALFRPGPLETGMAERYIAVKHGREKPEYPHPKLEAVLAETHGTIVYQEQVMQIAHSLAGFTMAEADELRKAMGKKQEKRMEEARERFVQRAIEHGVEKERAQYIGNTVARFAGYAFNKSHATAYAMLTYHTAYLKAHHPVEYMAALMSAFLDRSDKVIPYVEEARRMGIEVLPPDVNRSGLDFTVEDGKIRCGLGAIKNLGEKGIESILAARSEAGPFPSLLDLLRRVDLRSVDRRNLEGLVKCGAFDSLGVARSRLFEGLGETLALAASRQQDARTGQLSFFGDTAGAPAAEPPLPDGGEWPPEERLQYEKESLGFYLTSNPILKYESLVRDLPSTTIDHLAGLADGTDVLVGGLLSRVQTKRIKNGPKKGEAYVSFLITDLTGACDAVAFGEAVERVQGRADTVAFVRGRVGVRERGPQGSEQPSVRAFEVVPVEEAYEKLVAVVRLRLTAEGAGEATLAGLQAILREHGGPAPVVLEIDGGARIRLPQEWKVAPSEMLVAEVEEVLGPGSVGFVPKAASARKPWKTGR